MIFKLMTRDCNSINLYSFKVTTCSYIVLPIALHETFCRSLSDLVALNIGQIGENLALGSATVVKAAEDESICGLCHPRYYKISIAVLTSSNL